MVVSLNDGPLLSPGQGFAGHGVSESTIVAQKDRYLLSLELFVHERDTNPFFTPKSPLGLSTEERPLFRRSLSLGQPSNCYKKPGRTLCFANCVPFITPSQPDRLLIMSSSSKTSDSQNHTFTHPSASTSNDANSVPQYYFNNFLTEVANNREAGLRPRFAAGSFQTTEDSFLSSSSFSQNDNTAIDSEMINGPTENTASSGSDVLLDLQQFLSAENRAYLSNANPTPSFNGFDLPFIDNNGHNDGVQTFSYPNNGMFFGNQYVPNFDFGSESTSTGYLSSLFDQANNSSTGLSAPSTSQTSADVNFDMFTDDLLAAADATEYQSTTKGKAAVRTNVSVDSVTLTSDSSTLGSNTDNYANLNADFSQRSSAPKQLTSTAGYSAEATIPNAHMPMPSTSKAPYVDWNHTLGQTGGRYNGISMGTHVDPTIPTPQNFPPSPATNHTVAHDENLPVTSTTSSSGKRRYAKKPLPSKTLYTMQNGKYVCQYKGPARPEGCSVKTADVRNLCRHLRNHARREKKMDIPQEERVACNGVPGESLYLEVSCPFKKDADRGKCRFYRETGTIWKVMTLERWETVMDNHRAEYHSPGDGS